MKSPQYRGIPGWLFLTHDEDGVAHAFFEDEPVSVIMDERICCDTIFRTVRISKKVFVISDILVLNGEPIHGRKTYEERKVLIAELLDLFHSPDITSFVGIDDVPLGTLVRGYEHYDSLPGSTGIFLDTTT